MKWNGTVSQSGSRSIAARFRAAKTIHAMSTQCLPNGLSERSGCIDPVSLPPDGADGIRAELRPQPTHVDVDHIGFRFEVIAPDRRQDALLRHGPPSVAHQLLQQEELAFGERDRSGSGIRLTTDDIEREPGAGEMGRWVPGRAAQSSVDPREQLVEG